MWKRYADKILESFVGLVEELAVWANIFAMIMVFVLLLVTCPIWILPYWAWTEYRRGKE